MSDPHILMVHTTDARDRLWLTCSCGFETEPVAVDEESWHPIQVELVKLGHAHRDAATAATPKEGASSDQPEADR